jgi:hypothetical protein
MFNVTLNEIIIIYIRAGILEEEIYTFEDNDILESKMVRLYLLVV